MPEADEAVGRENQEAKGKVKKERPPKPPREKKEKPPKAQKPPKEKPIKEKKAKGEKKPMKAGMAALITALVFLALIGGAAAAVMTDLFGVRKAAAAWLAGGEDVLQSQQALALMSREQELNKREAELAVREKTATAKEKELSNQSIALSAREALLSEKEQQNASSDEALKQLTGMYAKMDAESAAGILSQIKDKQDITDILMGMNASKAAAILEAMEPALASEITLMMKSPAVAPAGTPTATP